MEIQSKIETIQQTAEEILGLEDLYKLFQDYDPLKMGRPIRVYDGFEPSGKIHIAQGLLRAITVNKYTSMGFDFIFYVADDFAFLNNKFNGNKEKIHKAGLLMIEMWKACGMDLNRVSFIWSSEEINKRPIEYRSIMMDMSRHFTINRMKKCLTALGKEDAENEKFSTLMYALMQASDIPFLAIVIASLGMDQRKVLTLNREYTADKKKKPVVVLHHILLGLNGKKMSKSDPMNAIFMDDSESDINLKIKKAFCPELVTEGNPIIEYVQYIIFQKDSCFTINRSEKHGGPLTFKSFIDFKTSYEKGDVHPADVKSNVSLKLNEYLQPVRAYIKTNNLGRVIKELSK